MAHIIIKAARKKNAHHLAQESFLGSILSDKM